jgi:glycosyltransferase involved in cell wall biosynthesis
MVDGLRIAIVADGRAENFRRWASFFVRHGDDVSVLSTYPCNALENSRLFELPGIMRVGNALVKRSDKQRHTERSNGLIQRIMRNGYDQAIYPVWSILKTFDIWPQMWSARNILKEINPDVVIAFRTQNEGYVTAMAACRPWVLFTQGQDFTSMANRCWWHSFLTRATVKRANGLMADCQRDINLARHYGFPQTRPARLVPGNGGVDLAVYRPGVAANQRERWVVYPRGLAPYLRLDTLLVSIYALQQQPAYADIRYKLLVPPAVIPVVDSMARLQRLAMKQVDILPFMGQTELATLLQRAAAIVSPSFTDGTPNSMLEAMACGALPIMSKLESVQEWICHGENGLLFDPTQPLDLAKCMQLALDDLALRHRAQVLNRQIIQERADYRQIMPEVRKFLQTVSSSYVNPDVKK